MHNHSTLVLASFLAFTVVMPMMSHGQTSAADHFARGKGLVEANCIENMDATQQGEEEGIRELDLALEQHYEKPVDAYKLLAEAYGNMQTYVQKQGEAASNMFRDKQRELYRKMYQLAPDDPEVLAYYEETVTDINEKIAINRKILSLKPNDARARFDLGGLLVRQNKVNEGLVEMKQGLISESNPEAVVNKMQGLIEALRQHECPLANDTALIDEAQNAMQAAMYKEGDPKPMAAFKQKLATAIDQHRCTPPQAK